MITGIGEIIKVSITSVSPNSKVLKGSVQNAVIVRTRSKIERPDGGHIIFSDNAVVLVNKDGEPIGTRVFGPISREVRHKNFARIASLAPEVL
jgi:large subunit ribosomal protein L14